MKLAPAVGPGCRIRLRRRRCSTGFCAGIASRCTGKTFRDWLRWPAAGSVSAQLRPAAPTASEPLGPAAADEARHRRAVLVQCPSTGSPPGLRRRRGAAFRPRSAQRPVAERRAANRLRHRNGLQRRRSGIAGRRRLLFGPSSRPRAACGSLPTGSREDRGGTFHMKLISTVLRLVCALENPWRSATWSRSLRQRSRRRAYRRCRVPAGAVLRRRWFADIPVAFQAGGPHAVVSPARRPAAPAPRWATGATAGSAMNTLAGRGVSVAARPVAPFSLCTELGPGRRQTVGRPSLSTRVARDWLAANKGTGSRARHRRRRPGQHRGAGAGRVLPEPLHAAQGSRAAVVPAYPIEHVHSAARCTQGMMQFGGVDHQPDVGARHQPPRWKWHDPLPLRNQLLIDNNTRTWVLFSPQTLTCQRPAGDDRLLRSGPRRLRSFYAAYRSQRRRQRPFRLSDRRPARLG